MPFSPTDWTSPQHRRSVIWIVALATAALAFDGYDLVVYGTILPILMDDQTQLGAVSAEQAGVLGSYALIGVLIGALLAGAFGDRIGRRKLTVISIAWFSVGMAAAAMTHSVPMFGAMRLLTGIGVGALIATAGAVVAEFAPAGKKNAYNAIVYCGVPLGGVMASLLALLVRDAIGWRGLFWIGALPLVVLLPLALAKLPESPRWLVARGRIDEAHAITARTGIPSPTVEELAAEELIADPTGDRKVGFAALTTRRYALGTALLGFMSFAGILLTYGLNTWLPKIMENAGFDAKNSLAFLLVLNGGAIIGVVLASRLADRTGRPQRIIVGTFLLAVVALVVLTLGFPLPVLLAAVAAAGIGGIGTQILIYGFVSNYYSTTSRAAGVAWCAGFGRLGGIFGPLAGGLIIGAGLSSSIAFYIFAGVALVGASLTMLVATRRAPLTPVTGGTHRAPEPVAATVD
ncbi:MFS transporter [Rhodococcus chondri]|uniref:Aromatic acid/H+ symport family MFS transporter n=1 Tax=Rhodococcus chondri TaxID=3065941 RepID=A0ABU7JVR1_9NOCA|nr:aromatic acid/H+ symport family MFS transporter [Rhodococcus sp. CC-R104]MEE2033847.1 aromatic acid/H+ symport family MFS transporter [Rhodococcus sp. CC-R104]